MGSRDDGGPATFEELRESFDRLAAIHGAKARQPINAARRTEFMAFERAYNDAANELERVMALLGKERTE